MRRVPQAAIPGMVKAALKPDGAEVCERLVRQLGDKEILIAERAARTLKKISEADAGKLYAWRKALVAAAFKATDVRVQWNLSIVLGRLPLKGQDKAVVVDLMYERLQDRSGLNRTLAMQALMDLSENDAALRARVTPVVREALEGGTPAMQARARKLLGKSRQ